MRHFDSRQLAQLNASFRRNLINCLPGYKPLQLIGTQNTAGVTNLALFSQIIHLGAAPPLIGVLFRPPTVKRDSLENILDTRNFSLNQVLPEWHAKAHWTAANWEESEFEATGLIEERKEGFSAPFVEGSPVQLGCVLEEVQTLQINQTVLVIARIEQVFVDEKGLREDGTLDYDALGTVSVTGLDEYHQGQSLGRLSYPKPGILPKPV
ncbi:MAG: flavin reductase family protein [Algoriphagus sp.]|nr:flavin reductase family protein [Algoriphagus sp.]